MAYVWANSWYVIPEPPATLQGVSIPSAILKIGFSLFFNAVGALASGGFRIVSDTLVIVKDRNRRRLNKTRHRPKDVHGRKNLHDHSEFRPGV